MPRLDTASDALASTVPLKGMRGAVAAAMMHSLHNTAQLTLHRQFDATALVSFRKSLDPDERPSLNDLVLAFTARVLTEHPMVNATVDEDTKSVHRWRAVNLGMAVALDDGLVVPVIRNADRLSLKDIRESAGRLATAARAGGLTMSDFQGGTFTVSNLGAVGVDSFTPILNPPQVAILGVGRLNGSASMLSLTIDHRALDGVPGGRFIDRLATVLEHPTDHL